MLGLGQWHCCGFQQGNEKERASWEVSHAAATPPRQELHTCAGLRTSAIITLQIGKLRQAEAPALGSTACLEESQGTTHDEVANGDSGFRAAYSPLCLSLLVIK
jgi:hypothetical protein